MKVGRLPVCLLCAIGFMVGLLDSATANAQGIHRVADLGQDTITQQSSDFGQAVSRVDKQATRTTPSRVQHATYIQPSTSAIQAQHPGDQHPGAQHRGAQHPLAQKTANHGTTNAGFPDLQLARPAPTDQENSTSNSMLAGPVISTVSSLAIVLGLFAGLVWISRRYGGASPSRNSLPESVLQTLGSTMLDAKTKLLVLRCGGKIVLVAQTASGMQPISEITDPSEVEQMIRACAGDDAGQPLRDSSSMVIRSSAAYA